MTLDWNVVVSTRERGFTMARELLSEYGKVQKSSFYNVLVMRVAALDEFLAGLEQRLRINDDLLSYVSRIAPVSCAFNFDAAADFDERMRECLTAWVANLSGKTFHVRMHRRGLKGAISSPTEERMLDEFLLQLLKERGTPGAIRFDDPDAVVDVETLDHRAGAALWTREDLKRYPFLRPE